MPIVNKVEVAIEIGPKFKDVKIEKVLADAMTARIVLNPRSVDTVVVSNLVCCRREPCRAVLRCDEMLDYLGEKTAAQKVMENGVCLWKGSADGGFGRKGDH